MDLDPEGALEGRNCLGGIIGDLGTSHLRCWGSPARSLNRNLEIRDNSGAFGRIILSNPGKMFFLYELQVKIHLLYFPDSLAVDCVFFLARESYHIFDVPVIEQS